MGRFSHLLSTGPRPVPTPGQRLRQAWQMRETGVALFRAQLLRDHPHLDDDARQQMLLAWLHAQEPLPPQLKRVSYAEYLGR